MQQEEEAKTSQGGNKSGSGNSQGGQNNSHHVTKWKEETGEDGQYGEYIDMEMDDECVSDVDSEN